MDELTGISGCSGIGGIDLGFKRAGRFRTVCYIEHDEFCQADLLEAMREGSLDTAPIWTDFRTFDGRPWRGRVDWFAAGIPCQPHSQAGKRLREQDPRNLWPDMARIIKQVRPWIVVVENVEGLYQGKTPYGPTVAAELRAMGYVVLLRYSSAAEAGAAHERMRTFTIGILPNAQHHGRGRPRSALPQGCDADAELPPQPAGMLPHAASDRCGATGQEGEVASHPLGSGPAVPDASGRGCEERHGLQARSGPTQPAGGWAAEPPLCRMADGLSSDLDRGLWRQRIKALGNAVVPDVAFEVAQEILKIIEG